MARHFLGLYVLIVLTLIAASWGQDRLLRAYGARDVSDEQLLTIALSGAAVQLRNAPVTQWRSIIAELSARSHGDYELFTTADIAGRETLDKLKSGQVTYMQAAAGETWALKQIGDAGILALKFRPPEARRQPLEWLITLLFYAAIALAIMLWIWPLTRDLRALESAAARYGNRNWAFDVRIRPRSHIYALAETFRKMALRIDGLIESHKDMSNAVSHEIKTPLSRMQFEIELARGAHDLQQVNASLDNIKGDIRQIDDLVGATLHYAILERADLALNFGDHDFAALLPAIAEQVLNDARPELEIHTALSGDTHHVVCDLHLIETAVKNLLYNAARHAKQRIDVTLAVRGGMNRLRVDDDGPGIPEQDRLRVFGSFVQLDNGQANKKGFGLGLAIVKRIIEWHNGTVSISSSPSGGARISAEWPATRIQ